MNTGRVLATAAALLVVLLALSGCAPVAGEPSGGQGGPGRLEEFVELGTIDGRGLDAAELGTPAAAALSTALARAGGQDLEQAQAALTLEPAPGERGFAFVLSGCAETGAVLQLSSDTIDADLTGGDGTNCAAAVLFLATFTVARADVPAGAAVR